MREEIAKLKRELVGTPVKFGKLSPKKFSFGVEKPQIGNRKSFLYSLKKLRKEKEVEKQPSKPLTTFKDTQITEYFKTKRQREEPAIELSLYKSFVFDGIDENSLTVG